VVQAKNEKELTGTGFAVKIAVASVVFFLLQTAAHRGIERALGDQNVYKETEPFFTIDNFMSDEDINSLRNFLYEKRRFVTGLDAFSDDRGIEHIGEGVDADENGNCPKDLYRTEQGNCFIPGRFDIGKHFFLSGGLTGAKETYEKLLSSIYAYYGILPKDFIETSPILERLFKRPQYVEAMDTLCRKHGQEDYYFKPTQVNIVLVTPGQDLPLHYDNGWFWGANRFTIPDYLTVAMTTSGLWDHLKIRQAQSVVYLHGSKEDPIFKHGGNYVFYPDGPGGEMRQIVPKRGSGVIMDGGAIPHGGQRIAEHHNVANHGSKDQFHRVEYQSNDTWYIMNDDDIISAVHTDDLRLSFVWRGLCFDSKEHAESYDSYPEIPLEEILDTFEADMKKRGVLPKNAPRPPPKEFAHTLIKTYISMPPQNVHKTLPFNFCILSKEYPWMKSILSPFCTDVQPYKRLNDELPPARPFCGGRMSTNCPEE